MLDEERIKLYLIEALQKLKLTPYQTKNGRSDSANWAVKVEKLLYKEG